MNPPLSDHDLSKWAREHLVYEGRMLAFTAVRLAERQGLPPAPETNVLLEAFVVQVRCLRDFLWGHRQHDLDALAADFCDPGVWEKQRNPEPPALEQARSLNRAAREVVHLTYHRLSVAAASKDWDVGEIYDELANTLEHFSGLAIPQRLDDATRQALVDLTAHTAGVGSASVATGAVYGVAFRSGTPGFTAGS